MCSEMPAPLAPHIAEDEEGGITVLCMFLFIGMLLAAGVAIDFNNMVKAQTQLQGAADAAGHAALYWRQEGYSEADSIAKAIEIAELNMPPAIYGNVLSNADVVFGDWVNTRGDNTPGVVNPDPGNETAVQVRTRLTEENSNGISTFLLKLLGQDVLSVTTVSAWDAEDGYCPPREPDKKRGEGFFAVGVVDMQTGNNYFDGFCVHSDTYVKLSGGNTFEDGVTVSMPDKRDLVLPKSGMDSNTGLEEALESLSYNLDAFFNDFPNLVNAQFDPLSSSQQPYITETVVNTIDLSGTTKLVASMLVPNAVNKVNCTSGSFDIGQNELIENVTVVTNCKVKVLKGAALENATLVTTNTATDSISGPEGSRFGASDYCTTGIRGANVLTLGGIQFASGFQAYGANFIADGYMKLAAAADGLGGINFMSGSNIDVTASSDMGFCGFGPPDIIPIPLIRMVM